jgi:hypothetical protein
MTAEGRFVLKTEMCEFLFCALYATSCQFISSKREDDFVSLVFKIT